MGRHQRAETSGLVSFLICAVAGGVSMLLYLQLAPAIWQVSQRLFMVCAGIAAACGVISFSVGYARRSRSWSLNNGWLNPIRRIVEILALSIVYAATIFLTSFMMLNILNGFMGRAFIGYLFSVCAGLCGIVGYVTFVQAELMDAKTLAALLPIFVVSGVSTAGLTTTDPYWFNNNFSQLGDRTTFAARMFNSTLMLAGICIIIISYFAISEMLTTHRQRLLWQNEQQSGTTTTEARYFPTRLICLSILLILCGVAFIGIGTFRYTPHPLLHNVFARGLPCVMSVLLVGLPWLAPQLSRAMFVISDLAIVTCAVTVIVWLMGGNTLTNVEALAGLLFLGWFIVFSRQIAAMEADRTQAQLLHDQALLAQGNKKPADKEIEEISTSLDSRLPASR